MRILLVILALGLIAASFAAPKDDVLDDRAAWREACKLGGYSCFAIPAPLVARAPMGLLYGRYVMGDRYILVDENTTGNLAYEVKVHEMVHYLQGKHGKWKFTKENSCQMEHAAFDVSNVVARRLGDTQHVVDWNVARLNYGCPL